MEILSSVRHPKFDYDVWNSKHGLDVNATKKEKDIWWGNEREYWIEGRFGLTGAHYFSLTQATIKDATGYRMRPVWRDLDDLIYGAMLEAGSYSTSYIPTFGTSVTRVADSCSKTGISDLIGQTEGVLYVEFDINEAVNTEGYIVRIDDTSFNDTVYISRTALKALIMNLRSGGSAIAQVSIASVSGRNKAAIAYKSGDFAFYLNGASVGTSTATYTNGITYNEIRLGGFNASVANMAGKINQAILFKTRLSNTELAQLTTI